MLVRSIIRALRYGDGREVPVDTDADLHMAVASYRTSRIVAIQYEDGSWVPVEDEPALALAVREFFELRTLDAAFPGMSLYELRDLAPDIVEGRKEILKEKARESGAAPKRKDITKQALLEYRAGFMERNEGGDRGWITSAALHFDCDEGTVRERMGPDMPPRQRSRRSPGN